MATAVIMPKQGQSVESCIISEWHKQKGDSVQVDDLLFTYETDKAAFDEKAAVAGTLLDVFFGEGDDVPCLTTVCVIGKPGEDTSDLAPDPAHLPSQDESESGKRPPEPVRDATTTASPPLVKATEDAGKKGISPRAKNLARRQNLDPTPLAGSGPQGRVIERDVLAAINRPQETAAEPAEPKLSVDAKDQETIPHSNIRKLIAASMQKSLSSMAQLTLHSSCDASDMLRLRKRLKQADPAAPTLNDLLLYAVSRVLQNHPHCNAWYDEDKLTVFRKVHLGVAIDTPRGLMVPTLFAAETMKLSRLAAEVRKAAAACREGSVSPDQLKNATFTVTSLGALGVESFTPVINPPQTCILGVGSITTRVREKEGNIKPYPALGLSLTFDHRALDGAPAARFLKDLVAALEDMTALLLTNL